MTLKFLNSLLNNTDNAEATGTYPDGVFHLTLTEPASAEKRNSLRASYERDHRAALKMENSPVHFA